MSISAIQKFQESISSEFVLQESLRPDMLTFRSKKANHHVFFLFHEVLTEYEILGIGKILVEVYGSVNVDIPKNDYNDFKEAGYKESDFEESDYDEETSLNHHEEFSIDFVRAVIDLEASALHKLLLLSYSRWIYSKERTESFIKLAKAKNKIRLEPDEVFSDRNLHVILKDSYIFPGVDPEVILSSTSLKNMHHLGRQSVELFSQVMAFCSNNFENVTLGEHLSLPLTEGLLTQCSFTESAQPNKICDLLDSGYRELACSMAFNEVNSLTHILNNSKLESDYPKGMLVHRSKVMRDDVGPIKVFGRDSVSRYLSLEELSSLTSKSIVDGLDELLKNKHKRQKLRTPPVIYAAIAEVLSVKGELRALEVAAVLRHLFFTSGDDDVQIYEATVAIIMLALNPETDDFPFGWIAQMSEHSWVLSSHVNVHQEFAEIL